MLEGWKYCDPLCHVAHGDPVSPTAGRKLDPFVQSCIYLHATPFVIEPFSHTCNCTRCSNILLLTACNCTEAPPPPTPTPTPTFLFLAPFLLLQALHGSGLRTLPPPSFSCHMEPQQKSETANSTERKTLDLLLDRFSQKVRWRCISVTHRVWKCFKHKVYKWHFQTIKKMEGTESKSFHQLACEKLGF